MNIISRGDPDDFNLYKIAINSISKNVNAYEKMPLMCRKLPDHVLFDLYYQVSTSDNLRYKTHLRLHYL